MKKMKKKKKKKEIQISMAVINYPKLTTTGCISSHTQKGTGGDCREHLYD